MTPQECVKGVAGPVGRLGGAWMFDAATDARGKELGLSTWSWYHRGRGGVLGECDSSVVVAAFGFFPPALQAKAWDKGVPTLGARETALQYAHACADWGRGVFGAGAVEGPGAGADRLADLLGRAMSAAEPAGLPLFAGWRALLADGPADGPGRLAMALQVAREHRGGNHLVAVVASGVDPLQAVMSGRYGAKNAEFFGWPQPWPDPSLAVEQMARAEALTDRLVAPAYAALRPDERAELTEGLRALRV